VRPVGEVKAQTGQKRERGGGRQFVSESIAELRKVEWPGQRQLLSATVVVIIAIAVVGLYLWVADEVFSRLVREVLLNN
jgi:preprotein translocase subunit SecE